MTRLLAILGVAIISFSGILILLADVAPSAAAFYRTAYALPVLVLCRHYVRSRDHRTRRDHLLAFLAGVLLAIDLGFWHRSIALIGAGLSTVLANVQVVFVGVAAWLMHRERPNRWAFAMIPLVFLGASLISGLGSTGTYGTDPLAGTLFGLLAALTYAAFLLLFRASNRRLSPVAGPLLDATAGAACAGLVLALLDGGLWHDIGWSAHGWLIVLALFPHVIGWSLIAGALPRLPALETSVLLLLQPAMTVLWAVLFFGERLSIVQWSGAAVVLGGVGLLSIKGSVQETSQPVPEGPVPIVGTGKLGEEI